MRIDGGGTFHYRPPMSAIKVTGYRVDRVDEVLTDEALGLVEQLHQTFEPERLGVARGEGEATERHRPRRAPHVSPRDERYPVGRVAGGAGPRRPRRPAGGDHRPGGAQDDDQRAQLGGQGLHGRLRGLARSDLAERNRGPGQPCRCLGPHPFARHRREELSARRDAGHVVGSPAGMAPHRAPCRGGRFTGVGQPLRLWDLHGQLCPEGGGTGERSLLLPAQAGGPSRGKAVERCLPRCSGCPRAPRRHGQGHGAHRDGPCRLRDGRDPLGAARATPPGSTPDAGTTSSR